jgi:DNA-binding transcriptional ArsR family regulator
VSRNHAHTVLDPEPLIVATPTLAATDPRLLEQVFGWCAAHADRISASRLKGLLSGSSESVVNRFSSFSRGLQGQGVKWPVLGSSEAWSPPGGLPAPAPLPLARPAMLRFRLRALSGVGARADVLTELLASPESWRSAAELSALGYTKRNVARVLAELDDAGIVASRAEGNTRRFRLTSADPLRELVGSNGLTAPSWHLLFGILVDLFDLLEHETDPAAVRRVEASKLRERLILPCRMLSLDEPPPTRGVPDAWDALVSWGASRVLAAASGLEPPVSGSPA